MLTLRTVALTRLMNRNALMPATTALGSMDRDYRADALAAGANVIMPNFTPVQFREKYEIYPDKHCFSESVSSGIPEWMNSRPVRAGSRYFPRRLV
ncbi:hypothetical protein [Brucepastera parasyntrophica]|uniref:hypothetical protein n=1 Tax=Brucepastera parasyntrophica TaxID=2880008 RepID=UPI0034E2EB3B